MNTAKPDNNRDILHVTLIGYKKVLGTSITIPMEMLNAADLIARIHHPKKQRLKLQVVSLDKTDIQLNAGLQIRCDLTLEDIDQTDMLILPAMWGNPLGVVKKYPEFLDWLRKTAANKPMICAVGTGSYFLAEAGLLDGLVATTHWYYFDQFESPVSEGSTEARALYYQVRQDLLHRFRQLVCVMSCCILSSSTTMSRSPIRYQVILLMS